MSVPASGVQAEAEYYQAVEDAFVRGRGEGLVLSNADWTLVRRWRRAGIPLRVVLRGVADVFETRRQSWARTRPIGNLRACAAEVQRAFERWQLALGGSVEAGPAASESSLAERLQARLRLALDQAPPQLRAAVEAVLTVLERERWPVRGELEPWLRAHEDRLLHAAEGLVSEQLARVEAELAAELAPYAARLPARVLAQVREEAWRARLLGACSLPRLTQFQA